MGVKNLSKMFEGEKTTFKKLKQDKVVIDAMIEIYRSVTGGPGLKDSKNRVTDHINAALATIFNLYKNNKKQLWVFDTTNINKKRVQKQRSEANQKNIEKLKKMGFTDEHIDNKKIHKWMITDIKFILDLLKIPYINAPENYEAEQIAAKISRDSDAIVLSTDMDTCLFGAKFLLKKYKKDYTYFDIDENLNRMKISRSDLIYIGIALGTDFNSKIRGIGPKTAIKKLEKIKMDVENDPILKKAYNIFSADIPDVKYTFNNTIDIDNAKNLLNWLAEEKSYNKMRRAKTLSKSMGVQVTDLL